MLARKIDLLRFFGAGWLLNPIVLIGPSLNPTLLSLRLRLRPQRRNSTVGAY